MIGYLAGLLDGEGCLTQANGHWRVQIAMTDEALIFWLGEFGGTVRERKVKGNRQRCWRWLLGRQIDVHGFLTATLPLLQVKRAKALLAIADIEKRNVPDVVPPS